MKKIITSLCCCLWASVIFATPNPKHDLHFRTLATVWDEGIPLGNGALGALIWEKNKVLRFSLDRSDIWDSRPLNGLHREEFSYEWIRQQVLKNDYKPVQEYFDASYEREPAPSKIPAGALEFTIPAHIKVNDVRLHLKNALCEIKWDNGMVLKTFVHANAPTGWFRFENMKGNISPQIVAPPYGHKTAPETSLNAQAGDDLLRLGYKVGEIKKEGNQITYLQEGWGGFFYEISVQWKQVNPTTMEGVWSISSQEVQKKKNTLASKIVSNAINDHFDNTFATHEKWWQNFWNKSAVKVPDALLEKQWYLEQYKFGSTARADTPPISLQAVWTADNGKLPPWKGDFHHDLNTQLSYWPSYSGNHLEEAMGYLNHLDENKANYKRYTQLFFNKEGLAVPGVTTLDGTEMGGWTQYSLSPTVSSWLAQHYYLQWRYSMDRTFLKERAYPWFQEVGTFIENITIPDENGLRKLPLSSSPEINDNKINAWFHQNTNYDLSLMKYVFQTAEELALELGYAQEAAKWNKLYHEFGDFLLSDEDEMMLAPGLPYAESHRHFSHIMAIHPLGLIKWEDGEQSQSIIQNTLALLETIGPDYWCGYSYSWLGNLYARAKDGENAAKALSIFAKAFCLPNSFHANGDQTKSGYSKFTYRPFTLEGNFAFAAGLQEMLLQSHAGFIEVFPATPHAWKDVSFDQLRSEGALLVSGKKTNGEVSEVKLVAEVAGKTKLKLPFKKWKVSSAQGMTYGTDLNGFLEINCTPGGQITLQSVK
jgi:alpha-L-fucosidase 2